MVPGSHTMTALEAERTHAREPTALVLADHRGDRACRLDELTTTKRQKLGAEINRNRNPAEEHREDRKQEERRLETHPDRDRPWNPGL